MCAKLWVIVEVSKRDRPYRTGAKTESLSTMSALNLHALNSFHA